jgi:DNA replication and repair protein RecF
LQLLWVELREFRNHRVTKLDELPKGLIVVVGPNGEGKTNLMEGMFYLFTLSSPRVSSNQPLVREGAGAGYVRGEVETATGRALIEVEIPGTGRASKVRVNRSPVRRKRDLRRQVRAVFFGPDDLDIVRGDPSQRRRFMDEALGALWPVKESAVTAYERALRQRNRLLKEWEGRGAPAAIEAWDSELVEAGCALMRARAEAIERLAPLAAEEFRWLANYGLACEYRPSVWTDAGPAADVAAPELEEAFRARIEERRQDEIVRRTSLVGPHRDDLELAVRDLGARSFGSHGEAWAAALCLRLGLAKAVEAELGEPPVLLVDDPFSALDPRRQTKVAEHLAGRGQVVISVADEAHVPPNATVVWQVSSGSVVVRGAA